ncbi:unnamed protein product [Leptosia nina]|uniref:Uncharacterized protein n=1 Tax=Leptosia nina TaxID=320188 RepID=A0AAV1JC54_9NEOP
MPPRNFSLTSVVTCDGGRNSDGRLFTPSPTDSLGPIACPSSLIPTKRDPLQKPPINRTHSRSRLHHCQGNGERRGARPSPIRAPLSQPQ